jgi:iron complex transport system ATP-binding protein
MLTVEHIQTGYVPGLPVLTDAGLALDAGKILAILGPNGSGKSTLLRCINGLIKPWQGAVRIAGEDVFRMRPNEIARRIGYVAQHGATARTTVFDAVLLGRKPHLGWSVNRTDLAKVGGALDRLGLHELALRHLDELSGGELQKVSIARALVQEPSVLLLDEPTSSLDLKNRLDILRILRSIVREHKMAAVITLHDLDLGFRFADRMLFLKDRKVFAEGAPHTIDADMIEAVYGVKVHIVRHEGRLVVVPLDCGEETR